MNIRCKRPPRIGAASLVVGSDQAVQIIGLGGIGHGLDVLVVLDAVLLAQLIHSLQILFAIGSRAAEVAEVVGLDGGLLHVSLLLLGLGQLIGLQPQIQHIAAELGVALALFVLGGEHLVALVEDTHVGIMHLAVLGEGGHVLLDLLPACAVVVLQELVHVGVVFLLGHVGIPQKLGQKVGTKLGKLTRDGYLLTLQETTAKRTLMQRGP